MKNTKLLALIGIILVIAIGLGAYALTGGFNGKKDGDEDKNRDTKQEESADKDDSDEKDADEEDKDDDSDSDSDSDSNVTVKSGCELFTTDEATKLLGTKMINSDPTSKTGCTYTSENMSEFIIMVIGVSEMSSSQTAQYRVGLEMLEEEIEDISVSGDDASFWLPTYYQLHTIKNGNVFIVSIVASGDLVGKEKEKSVAAMEAILRKI